MRPGETSEAGGAEEEKLTQPGGRAAADEGGFSGKLRPTEVRAPQIELRAFTAREGDALFTAPQEPQGSACISHLPPQPPTGTVQAARNELGAAGSRQG